MLKIPARFILGIIIFVTIGAVTISLIGNKQPLVDRQKLEIASASGISVPISTILLGGATTICVLGPYQDPTFHRSDINFEFLKQMDQSSVPEGFFRIATFNGQADLLQEEEMPRGRGPVRISALDPDPIFCGGVETMMINIVEHDRFMTIQFIR
jgi:hypothetical protein